MTGDGVKTKRVKTKPTLPYGYNIQSLASIQAAPITVNSLIPVDDFTPEHVNNFFGIDTNIETDIDGRKYLRMLNLLLLWHEFCDSNVALFDFSGPCNVWGFHSVRVSNREVWNARIFDTASKMARQVNGQPAKRPVQSIYEIMRYNSMRAQTTNGLYSAHADKKAMLQDYYYYNPNTSEKTKKRVRGW
jgi:hypothetical protein